MIGRAVAFVIIVAALQFGWHRLEGSPIQHLTIDQGIVAPAAGLARLLTPQLPVYARGNQLLEPAGGLNIINGCDGMETLFLLAAGLLVAPLPGRARLVGILAAIPVVYALNLARILALFYAHRRDRGLFDLLHGIVTPAVMVGGAVAFLYLWLRLHPAGEQPAP
jgi:exosortase/archaeosortase family protein